MSNDAETEAADVDEQEPDEAPTEESETEAETVEGESTEEEAEEKAQEEAEDGLQAGDFVELDYTARTVEGGDLVDTTHQEVADEEGVGEDQEFAPRTIVLGEGHLFEKLEEDVVGKDVGDGGTVVVPAEEGFGEYDENQVRTVSTDKIPEDDRYPGAAVTVDGQEGYVETIIGGRARVDFNHPLAGEDIEYEYEILREVTDREEQAEGLIDMFLNLDLDVWFETDTVEEERPVESDDGDGAAEGESDDEAGESADEESEADDEEPEFETVEVERETLYIEATPQLSMNQQWMMGKQQIAQRLTQILDVDRIIVQEELGGGMGMGIPGMMGGGGGGDLEEALGEAMAEEGDLEEGDSVSLDDVDVDAEEIAEELEGSEE